MSDLSKNPLPTEDDAFVQELAWKMLDDQLDEEEAEQLSLLLLHSEPARKTYIQVVQMHMDLLCQFGGLPEHGDLVKMMRTASASKVRATPKSAAAETPTTEPTGA